MHCTTTIWRASNGLWINWINIYWTNKWSFSNELMTIKWEILNPWNVLSFTVFPKLTYTYVWVTRCTKMRLNHVCEVSLKSPKTNVRYLNRSLMFTVQKKPVPRCMSDISNTSLSSIIDSYVNDGNCMALWFLSRSIFIF